MRWKDTAWTVLRFIQNATSENPAVIGHNLVAEAWVTKREGKKFYTEGVLKDGDTVIVTATGLYYEMDMSVFLTDDQK